MSRQADPGRVEQLEKAIRTCAQRHRNPADGPGGSIESGFGDHGDTSAIQDLAERAASALQQDSGIGSLQALHDGSDDDASLAATAAALQQEARDNQEHLAAS